MIGKLRQVDLKKIWKNEATDFTPWLAENLSPLSEAIGFDLTLSGREQKVGPFSADIVATDEEGRKVIIENQLEKTDHGHLGQILTYLTNLECSSVIWISPEPRQEHMNAITWLNTHTPIDFYLVKLEAISIDESKPAPLFHVLCRPDEEIRSAIASESELTARDKFNIQFWTEVNKRCVGKLPGFTTRKPLKYHFHSQASGKGGINFTMLATARFYGIELYIDTSDADLNEYILRQLENKRSAIEQVFGHKLNYDDIPEKRACRIRYVIVDSKDVMDLEREKVQQDLVDHMARFEKAIKPLLKDLDYDVDKAA